MTVTHACRAVIVAAFVFGSAPAWAQAVAHPEQARPVQGDPGKWAIELKARQPQLAQYLGGMQLSGGRFVEEIRISETGGDSTQIRFGNSQGAAVLNEAELSLFGGDSADRTGTARQ